MGEGHRDGEVTTLDGPVLVTGGAGFIGSALVRKLVRDGVRVINVDALTYAGNLASLSDVDGADHYTFEHVDIRDAAALRAVFHKHRPAVVFHLAAESHVDRSIDGPAAFVTTNVVGTFNVLESAREVWDALPADEREACRFVHVSTDEVFGALGKEGRFTPDSCYAPHSPYSAAKAGSDHLARAWHHTYGLPVIVTNCSNNYGPRQFPEKLIPLTILAALDGGAIPVYGDGSNVRDWLYVEDHVDALLRIAAAGRSGATYLVGGGAERSNLDVVTAICRILDREMPDSAGGRELLITFVPDRPGHDFRYAVDAGETRDELGWSPRHSFDEGLLETVRWYVSNRAWCETVRAGQYRGERLGLKNLKHFE